MILHQKSTFLCVSLKNLKTSDWTIEFFVKYHARLGNNALGTLLAQLNAPDLASKVYKHVRNALWACPNYDRLVERGLNLCFVDGDGVEWVEPHRTSLV